MNISKDLLYSYFEGTADQSDVSRIKAWAEESSENTEALLKERRVYDSTILCGSEVKFSSPARSRVFPMWLRVACGLLFLLSVSFGVGSIVNLESYRHNLTTISVPPGQRTNIKLPDGSNVWLNAGSSMSYASDFSKKRELSVEGMAYFDVTHDPDHPLVVHTYMMDVKVLGTKFQIDADPSRNVFETSLLQGKVKLYSPSGNIQAIDLSPDQKVSFRDGKYYITSIDDYEVFKWTDGLYCFTEKRFSEILMDLERYFDKDIVYDPVPSLEKTPLTGKIRISDGLDYALKVLQDGLKFKCTRDPSEDKNVIYITVE